ncbi:hypothetical protein LTS14_002678 [Recurvomyces mirabilis]|uniref:uncharacterized protein n=1 Tax=Recurvomyces mirabilis TaxID=574656 RepID=UPI002DDDD4D6|nr:hypothetical protein LTS14_002678 [Recurvomyces mirabilis]
MLTFVSTTVLSATLFASLGRSLPTNTASSTPSGSYSLIADWSGANFFDNFAAFTGADPTNGNVRFVSMEEAASKGYTGFVHYSATNTSNAYIGVDYTSKSANRESVRLTSKQNFDAGVVIISDVVHAPSAYGSWPALWLLGDESATGIWPGNGGEYDYFESVHTTDYNSMTMHTQPGCSVDNTTTAFQGRLQNADCNTGKGGDGCSIRALNQDKSSSSTLATAGAAFNKQGGGVYANVWTTQGVATYLFDRKNLPADIVAGKPNPSSWTSTPLARFSGTGCDYTSSLSTLVHVIDHTFCGDWAGKVWQSSGAAAATNTATCAEYVQNNPSAFKDAYFEIASIKIYGASGISPGRSTYAKRDVAPAPIAYPTIDLRTRDAECPDMPNATVTSTAASSSGMVHHHAHGLNHTHLHGHHNHTANSTMIRTRLIESSFEL